MEHRLLGEEQAGRNYDSPMAQDAVVRNFEIISEAVKTDPGILEEKASGCLVASDCRSPGCPDPLIKEVFSLPALHPQINIKFI